MTTDPVCDMEVDESDAEAQEEYEGIMYYFCSSGCHESFQENPEQYV